MMFTFFYKRPYLLAAVILGFSIMGILGLKNLPQNLFPNSAHPTIIVLTQVPGATAKVVANTTSKPIEQEVARLSQVLDISSTNVANFSIVKVEFKYTKGLSAAAVDVSNALAIVKSKLPANAQPAVYTTGAFTLPVDVISMTPKNNQLSLADLRKVADSFIKPALLSNPVIGNVEVFGGHQSAINIEFDPLKARKYDISLGTVAKRIEQMDRNIPLGFIKGKNGFFTLTYYGEENQMSQLRQLPITPDVILGQLATVHWGQQKDFSAYMGNGKPAIALSIQRAPNGSVLSVSNAARKAMKGLENQYPNIQFSISDTQRDLIKTANSNMLDTLRDSIILTLLVMFFFLGNFRALLTAGVSIPLVFLGTIAIIYVTGGEMNIIIYTAIILSLGLLADDAVVVLENIERHIVEEKQTTKEAVIKGTKEVMMPVFAGSLATSVIVFPLMFTGGFPQQIFRPLVETLLIAIWVSYFVAMTFIPVFSAYLYRNGAGKTGIEKQVSKLFPATLGRLQGFYTGVLKFSNGGGKRWPIVRRMMLTSGVLIILMLTLKNVMPLIGRDTMPPMDTGIIKVQLQFSANDTVENAQAKLTPFLNWLDKQPQILRSSIAFGSEAGVLSLGSGNLPNEATMTIDCVNRFERKKTIWQLETEIRDQLHDLVGVKKADVFSFGATAVSSVKAPVDVRISSPSIEGLPEMAHKVKTALEDVNGFTSINQSWNKDFVEIRVDINQKKALYYGLTPAEIAAQIPIKGQVIALTGNLESMNSQNVRLYLKGKFEHNIQGIESIPIQTKKGEVPLNALAKLTPQFTEAKIERDQLLYSVDVNAYRNKRPLSMLTDDTVKTVDQIDTQGYRVSQQGGIKTLDDSFTRMIKSLGIGLFLLFLVLLVVYRSVILAAIMIVMLPLTMIGAAWGMLVFDKPSCMPSLVGIILLFGIVVKNSILLVDFYQESRQKLLPFESALESIRIRLRPVLMTSFATIAGMTPIALELAVGLERLSPLADVAIGGLLVSASLITLIYIPMYAYTFDQHKGELLPKKDNLNA